MLIPTKSKFKLSKDMTYPIGAELISEALAGVPQFEKLTISFTPNNPGSASSFREMRKQNPSYKIFQVSMFHLLPGLTSPKKFIEDGFYDERWEIHVYSVPGEIKSIVKQLLIDDGMPKAKLWLTAPRTEMWKTGRRHFQVLFDEKENRISIVQD